MILIPYSILEAFITRSRIWSPRCLAKFLLDYSKLVRSWIRLWSFEDLILSQWILSWRVSSWVVQGSVRIRQVFTWPETSYLITMWVITAIIVLVLIHFILESWTILFLIVLTSMTSGGILFTTRIHTWTITILWSVTGSSLGTVLSSLSPTLLLLSHYITRAIILWISILISWLSLVSKCSLRCLRCIKTLIKLVHWHLWVVRTWCVGYRGTF